MADMIIKSLEFNAIIQDIEYLIKVFIISAPDDLGIINIDHETSKGFIYQVSIQTEPQLPDTMLNISENLTFVIGSDGLTMIGHLKNGHFLEIEDNEFANHLQVNILEVLILLGDTGDFILLG